MLAAMVATWGCALADDVQELKDVKSHKRGQFPGLVGLVGMVVCRRLHCWPVSTHWDDAKSCTSAVYIMS